MLSVLSTAALPHPNSLHELLQGGVGAVRFPAAYEGGKLDAVHAAVLAGVCFVEAAHWAAGVEGLDFRGAQGAVPDGYVVYSAV